MLYFLPYLLFVKLEPLTIKKLVILIIENFLFVCVGGRGVGGTEMEKANICIVFSPVSLLINCTLLKKEFIAVCDLTGFVILTANLKR